MIKNHGNTHINHIGDFIFSDMVVEGLDNNKTILNQLIWLSNLVNEKIDEYQKKINRRIETV